MRHDNVEEDGMGFAGLAPSPQERAENDAIKCAVAAERERCARIAEAHRGSAGANRRAKGQHFRFLSKETVEEIQAEERGEDIAAEMIAKAIRTSVEG